MATIVAYTSRIDHNQAPTSITPTVVTLDARRGLIDESGSVKFVSIDSHD